MSRNHVIDFLTKINMEGGIEACFSLYWSPDAARDAAERAGVHRGTASLLRGAAARYQDAFRDLETAIEMIHEQHGIDPEETEA